MLTLNILNNAATLNTFFVSGTKEFMAGEDVKLIMRLIQIDLNLRYIPVVGATITIDFKKSDDTILTKTATFPFADDRSIIQVDLTELESADLISQTLIVKLDEAGVTTFATLQSGLKRNKLSQGC